MLSDAEIAERINRAIERGVYMDEPTEYPKDMINPRAKFCGTKWSHMWCEPGHEAQLHATAKSLGLRRDWFQNRDGFPHYDLTVGMFWKAYRMGIPVADLKEWVRRRRMAEASEALLNFAAAWGSKEDVARVRAILQ